MRGIATALFSAVVVVGATLFLSGLLCMSLARPTSSIPVVQALLVLLSLPLTALHHRVQGSLPLALSSGSLCAGLLFSVLATSLEQIDARLIASGSFLIVLGHAGLAAMVCRDAFPELQESKGKSQTEMVQTPTISASRPNETQERELDGLLRGDHDEAENLI